MPELIYFCARFSMKHSYNHLVGLELVQCWCADLRRQSLSDSGPVCLAGCQKTKEVVQDEGGLVSCRGDCFH